MAALPVSTTVSATLPFTHNGQPVAPVPSCNHQACHKECVLDTIQQMSHLYATLATLANFVERITNKGVAEEVNDDSVEDINKLATMVLKGNGFDSAYQQDFEANFSFSLKEMGPSDEVSRAKGIAKEKCGTFITPLMSSSSAEIFRDILNKHCNLARPHGWVTTRLRIDSKDLNMKRIAIQQSIFDKINWKAVAVSLSVGQTSATSTSSTSTSTPVALLPTEPTVPAKQAQPKESKQ